MLIKRLLNRYFLLFIAVAVVSVFFKVVETKEQKLYLKSSATKINKIYEKYINDIKEYNQILFYSHISNNTKLYDLLSSDIEILNIDDNLEKDLNKTTLFFKKYYIDEITVYTNNYEVLFNSSLENSKISLSTSYKNILEKVGNEKKEFTTIVSSQTSSSLKIFKPILDRTYRLLGFFETSINLEKLNHKILINEGIEASLIFKKEYLNKHLNEKFLKDYATYKYNNEYLNKNSFYKTRNDYDIDKPKLLLLMKDVKSFELTTSSEKGFIKRFVPVLDSFSNEKIAYMIFTKSSDEYLDISYRYNILISLVILFMLFVSIIYEKYKKNKHSFSKLQIKLNDITKSIDKYVIIVETDLEGIVTYCSQAFCDISGYKKDEIIGRPVSIVRNPDISKNFFENMWSQISKGKTWEGEIKNIDKNGNSYWEKGVISPIYSNNKNLIGYRAIKVNITDEKQLQKVNSLLKKELFFKLNEIKTIDQLKIDESKIKLMSQILDTFSNEWKKPISNISSSLLDFENRVDKAIYTKSELKDFLVYLREEVKYLSINLNEFRKLFIQSDKNDKYNIYEVIKSVIDSFCTNQIEFSFVGDKKLEAFGVFYDLKKVISGIVINSLDVFKTKEIKNGQIIIELSEKEDTYLIKVKDNAGGIPKEILPKIFDYNFSTKYHTKVEGLPLYLAKLIVEKSDGKLWVENIDDGCIFFIELKKIDRRSEKRELV